MVTARPAMSPDVVMDNGLSSQLSLAPTSSRRSAKILAIGPSWFPRPSTAHNPSRRARADASHPFAMGDIPPCPTIYVNNLNEKIKKDGARRTPPDRFP